MPNICLEGKPDGHGSHPPEQGTDELMSRRMAAVSNITWWYHTLMERKDEWRSNTGALTTYPQIHRLTQELLGSKRHGGPKLDSPVQQRLPLGVTNHSIIGIDIL